jgi:hypothetical protein
MGYLTQMAGLAWHNFTSAAVGIAVLSRSKTQEEAAWILGLDASTLWRKRRKYEDG